MIARMVARMTGLGVMLLAAGMVFFVSAVSSCPTFGAQIYWNSSGSGIMRANLDGSGAEWVMSGHAFGVAVDPVGEHLYWNSFLSGLCRANLDGTDPQVILPGAGEGDMTYTPEPATLSLLALGGLVAFRRRR